MNRLFEISEQPNQNARAFCREMHVVHSTTNTSVHLCDPPEAEEGAKNPSSIVTLTRYRGHQKHVVIPSSVMRIGPNAFRRCTDLEEIEIPSHVTSIGAEAFNGCHRLKKITFQEGLREIDHRAFWYCSALREVTLPMSLIFLGSRTFECCSNLLHVTLKNPGTHVDEYAFNETPYFNKLLAKAAVHMNRSGNDYYNALHTSGSQSSKTSKNLVLPEGMTHIDLWAFARSRIESVYIPNSMRTIGMCAFRDCKELTRVSLCVNTYCNYRLAYQPDDGIFAGCTSLEEVELRGSLRDFVWSDADAPEMLKGFHPEKTFYGCNKLKRMIAHEVALSAFPNHWKRYAVNGYLADEARKEHYLPEVAAEYDAYLASIQPQLIKRTELDHSYALHQYLMEHEMIGEGDIGVLLERARRADAADVVAALLTYEKEKLTKSNFLTFLDEAFLDL